MAFFKKRKKDHNSIIRQWDTAPHKGIVHYNGSCSSGGFYVYNYDLINDLRLNTSITIEAVAADVFLYSESSGYQKFTVDSWGVAYSLDSQLLGAAATKKNEIRKYLKDGYTVRVDAVIAYDEHIKAKTLLLGYSHTDIED